MEHNEQRRSSLKKIGMGFAALLGVGTVKAAAPKTEKKVLGEIVSDQDIPSVFWSSKAWKHSLYSRKRCSFRWRHQITYRPCFERASKGIRE